MKNKTLLLCAVFTASIAFGFSRGRAPEPVPSPTPSLVAPSPTPAPSLTQLITVRNIEGATASEITMIRAGEQFANEMVKKACFKQWVLSANYTETDGLSQAEVYNKIISTPMQVDVEMYTGTWKQNHVYKTVGWEADPFDGIVHMNRYFVKTARDVGDNLIHEDRGHSIGFHHYGNHATSEPYGMNYAYEGCANQMMQKKGGKPYKPPGLRLEIRKKKKHEKKSK
jgi:hypothetical protein